MSLTLTVTNAGRAAIVNAAKDGTNAVRIASVGVSATATTPGAATTALPGEIKRITTIAGDAVAADTIHVTIRDETNALYAVRSIALYLADGTLFAAYGQADVLVEKSAQAMLLLALDVRFADIAATSLTFGATNFLNPPATTETAGVAELATDAETSTGTDDRRAVTPKGLSFALSARLSGWGSDIWRASNDGAGSGLDADLLDGREGAYYSDVVGRLGFWPVRQGTGIGQIGNVVHIGWSGSRLKATVDNLDLGNVAFDAQLADVWRASNDGAGSGLDADLLDGRHASEFVSKAGDTINGGLSVENLEITKGDLIIGRTSPAWGYIVRPNVAGSKNLQFAAVGGGPLENIELNTTVLTRQGNVIWHGGNDGAGSGLDADLLRGRDLINSPAFTGSILTLNNGLLLLQHDGTNAYLRPVNGTGSLWLGAGNNHVVQITQAGAVMISGGTAWHAGNDGAGSGLDADLLDGHDGGYYADLIGRLGFWPVRQGTGIGQLSNVVQMGWSGTRVKVTIDASDMGNIVFDNHIADVWRVSNDGAGSGLDADLLDGRQASDFALLNDGARFGANGNGYWERRPNGVIEQWGTAVGPFSEGQVSIAFPTAFTNADSINISATGVNSFGNNRYDITIQRVSRSTDGCTLMVQYTAASTSINQIDGIDWRAVGI
jgi:hypothetical protein